MGPRFWKRLLIGIGLTTVVVGMTTIVGFKLGERTLSRRFTVPQFQQAVEELSRPRPTYDLSYSTLMGRCFVWRSGGQGCLS
jgi:hypothetical protein